MAVLDFVEAVRPELEVEGADSDSKEVVKGGFEGERIGAHGACGEEVWQTLGSHCCNGRSRSRYQYWFCEARNPPFGMNSVLALVRSTPTTCATHTSMSPGVRHRRT